MSSIPVVQSNPALLLNEKDNVRVIVHPLAILQVLDHHSRRHEGNGRVIGTLLGVRIDDGLSNTTIEITNCFGVPHAERGEEVAIGKDFNRKMLALHMRSSKEVVVGWYASSKDGEGRVVTDTSSLIHEFYAGECDDNDPIHLVIDTRLVNQCLQIHAFKSAPVIMQGDHVGNVFHELPLSLHSNEPETICLNEMIKGGVSNPPHKSESNLQVSMEQLYELLDSTLKYVDAVVDGTIQPDAEKGRQIADTLATVPRVRPEILDKLFHNSLQDLLMVTYLSNLTRTQLEIAEKLNATLGSA
jgi:translation initiation factor 3 subunit F